jgi:hypothetical protein
MKDNSQHYKTKACGLVEYPLEPGRYEGAGAAIGRLVDKKQRAYGRSFDLVGSVLKIVYPHGIRPEQYDDLGAMIRILDKFFRIATDKDALGESPWTDVAGYGLLMNRDFQDPGPEVSPPEPQGETGTDGLTPSSGGCCPMNRR